MGDIYITTKNFINGAAVAEDMKYGVWERYAQGRALVGVSSNGYLDGEVGYTSEVWWRYKLETWQIGSKFGMHNYQLSEAEMPSHKHSTNNVFNKFSARAADVLDRDSLYLGKDRYSSGPTTVNGGDNNNTHDESMVNGYTPLGWQSATESFKGGNQAIPFHQPSIVVGIWRRVA